MKVCDIKNILNNAIDELDNFEDMDEVELQSNYGGMGDFIYIDGISERGYVDLNNINIIQGDET